MLSVHLMVTLIIANCDGHYKKCCRSLLHWKTLQLHDDGGKMVKSEFRCIATL